MNWEATRTCEPGTSPETKLFIWMFWDASIWEKGRRHLVILKLIISTTTVVQNQRRVGSSDRKSECTRQFRVTPPEQRSGFTHNIKSRLPNNKCFQDVNDKNVDNSLQSKQKRANRLTAISNRLLTMKNGALTSPTPTKKSDQVIKSTNAIRHSKELMCQLGASIRKSAHSTQVRGCSAASSIELNLG